MQFKRFGYLCCSAVIVVFGFLTPAAYGQKSYPDRPIRMIVPFAAGSAADSLSRLIAKQLAAQLGQAVLIDNKAGAGGTIGTAQIARAAPDGYTVGLAAQGTFVNNQVLYAKTGYDSLADFSHIAQIADVQNVLVVAADAPYKTASDLIAAIAAKPDRTFKYSSSGAGTSHHIAGATMAQYLGKSLMHVPYLGAPQGMTAVLSGDVEMGLYNLPAVLGLVRSGKLKAIAVTGPIRSPLLAEVPTLDESGLKGYSVTLWFGIVGPAQMPSTLIDRLHSELNKIMTQPEIRKSLIERGFTLPDVPLAAPADFERLIYRDMNTLIPVLKKLGLESN